MSLLMYLFVEIILMGGCLYVVSMCENTLSNHVIASTSLALAIHTCACGIAALWKDVGIRWNLWRTKAKKAKPAKFEVAFQRAVLRCGYAIRMVLGYTALISTFTLGPIYGIPIAYSAQQKLSPMIWTNRFRIIIKAARKLWISFWYSEEWVGALMAAKMRAEDLSDYIMYNHGDRINRIYSEVKPYALILRPFGYEVSRYFGGLSQEVQRHKLLLDDDRELKELWIVLTLGLCVLAVVLYRILIRQKSLSHAVAISTGVIFSFFIGRDTFVRLVAQRDPLAVSSGGYRLDSITYKLSILDQACHCLDRSLPALAVASCATIMLFIQIVPTSLLNWFPKLLWRTFAWAVLFVISPREKEGKVNLFRYTKHADSFSEVHRANSSRFTPAGVAPDRNKAYDLMRRSINCPDIYSDDDGTEDRVQLGLHNLCRRRTLASVNGPDLNPQPKFRESHCHTSIVKTE